MTPFERLMAMQAPAEPEFVTPTRIRVTALAHILQAWCEDGATESQVDEMWRSIQAERARQAETLAEVQPTEIDLSAAVLQRFLDGVSLHSQACDALHVALDEGIPEACDEAIKLVKDGDSLIVEAESELRRLRATYR